MIRQAVLDASVAVEISLGRGTWPAPEALHTHAVLDIETVSVLRRCVLRDELLASHAREALDIPLLTLDRTLAKTATRHCDVILPGGS